MVDRLELFLVSIAFHRLSTILEFLKRVEHSAVMMHSADATLCCCLCRCWHDLYTAFSIRDNTAFIVYAPCVNWRGHNADPHSNVFQASVNSAICTVKHYLISKLKPLLWFWGTIIYVCFFRHWMTTETSKWLCCVFVSLIRMFMPRNCGYVRWMRVNINYNRMALRILFNSNMCIHNILLN